MPIQGTYLENFNGNSGVPHDVGIARSSPIVGHAVVGAQVEYAPAGIVDEVADRLDRGWLQIDDDVVEIGSDSKRPGFSSRAGSIHQFHARHLDRGGPFDHCGPTCDSQSSTASEPLLTGLMS